VAYLATYSARESLARLSSPYSYPLIGPTFDLHIVRLRVLHQQRRSLAIQRIGRIGIAQQLRQEDLEDVDHVVHRRPSLVDHVETDTTRELVDVGVEDAVDKADAGRLVRVLVGELDVDFPEPAEEGCCRVVFASAC
jgi:hypothetical protein